jgi:hypothetical protein
VRAYPAVGMPSWAQANGEGAAGAGRPDESVALALPAMRCAADTRDVTRETAPFASNEELYEAVRALASQLASAGDARAASGLREGLAAVNGLTDGWALLLEAVEDADGAALAPGAREALALLRTEVRRVVRRR